VICTLDNPVYLTCVRGKTVHCLDRSARPRTITFDPTEYRFKLALLKNNYEEMLYIIRTSTLLGSMLGPRTRRSTMILIPRVDGNLTLTEANTRPQSLLMTSKRQSLRRLTCLAQPRVPAKSNTGLATRRWLPIHLKQPCR
jgi:hypothetical protein